MFGKHTSTRHGESAKRVLVGAAGTAVGIMALLAGPAMAAASVVSNGGFAPASAAGPTAGGFTTLADGSTQIPGWTSYGSVDWINGYWASADTDGYSLDLDGNSSGGVGQVLDTVAGAEYVVQFSLAGNPDGGAGTKTVQVDATGSPYSSYSFTVGADNSRTNMGWQTYAYAFQATGTQTNLTFLSATAGAYGPALDNVTVTQVVASGAECKNGGWASGVYDSATSSIMKFTNQGQCVSHFATSGQVPIGS